MNTISRTLALLKPADFSPAWKWIDVMEERGEIEASEARLWKEGIYGLMVLWDLKPNDVLGPLDQRSVCCPDGLPERSLFVLGDR